MIGEGGKCRGKYGVFFFLVCVFLICMGVGVCFFFILCRGLLVVLWCVFVLGFVGSEQGYFSFFLILFFTAVRPSSYYSLYQLLVL